MKVLLIVAVLLFVYTKYQDKVQNETNSLNQINIEYEKKYSPQQNFNEVEPVPTPIEEPENTNIKPIGEIFKKNKEKNIDNKTQLSSSIKDKLKKLSIKRITNDIKYKIQDGLNKLKNYATVNKQ